MSRFKKPLQGISRLSDRAGGGIRLTPQIIWSTQNAGVDAVPNHMPSDLILHLSSGIGVNNPRIPTGFTNIILANSSGVTPFKRANYKIGDGNSFLIPTATSTQFGYGVLIRGHGGIGKSTSVISPANSPINIGAINDVSEGSRILSFWIGSKFVSQTGQIGDINGRVVASLNYFFGGESFGGIKTIGNETSASQMISVEVLAA